MFGYAGKLLFVDLSTKKIEKRKLDEKTARQYIGGSALGAKVLYDEMPANTDAFAPESMVGFVCGSCNATGAFMSARYTVVSKSPVTGGWNDANSGGTFGPMLKRAGFDGVFVKGIAPKPVYIYIEDGNVEIRDASELWGKTILETEKALDEQLKVKTSSAIIGPAGERMHKNSAVMNDSHRAAGRGGTGAVMGSKRLKAIVVKGSQAITVADKNKILEINKSVLDWQKNGPVKPVVDAFYNWGTGASYESSVLSGDASIKNWLGSGVIDMTEDQIKAVSAIEMDKKFRKKKYACFACPVGCGAIYAVKEGNVEIEETGRPEYETAGMFGSQLLNGDSLSVNQCNFLCNEYGLDTITTGGTVAWAMECYTKGILSKEDLDGIDLTWGNAEAIVAITEKICKGEGVGLILAEGSVAAAKHFGRGEEALVVAGGIEIPQHDSRYGPPLARTYKYDPTPGRHVKGGVGPLYGNNPPEVKFNYDGFAEEDIKGTSAAEIRSAAGFCEFIGFGHSPGASIGYMNAATGFDYSDDDLFIAGKRSFIIRHAFNLREGFTRKDATISDRIIGVPPLEEGPLAEVTVDVEHMGDNFFKRMGFDVETGIPFKKTLEEIGGLENVIRDLYPA